MTETRKHETKKERRVMRIQCSSMVGWRLVPLLVAGLGTLIQTVNAQQNFRTVTVGGGGSGQGFIQG
ncbi:MAG TPA: hypothetical protein VK846_04545, partial [Candidatus Limnocylindria bacterium]|nr:hypothetical protein [Candidatus Limnocylindria bacterium]